MSATLDLAQLDSQLRGLRDAPHWLVAFSGGLDSTVLLHLLHRWCAEHTAPPLAALHVNHALQAEADDWAAHCLARCEQLGVPCRTVQVAVTPAGQGIEAAAREARYAALAAALEPGAIVFTAHHLDDQVETLFLRLLRGAGLAGLAAMAPKRPLGQGWLVRPLLELPRVALESYAAAHALDWIDDPSNGDPQLDRNYLRHEVLPRIEARWPAYRQTVGRASAHLAEAERALAASDSVLPTCYSVMGDPGVDLQALLAGDVGAAARRLRHWLRGQGLPLPDQAPLREFIGQLRSARADAAPLLRAGSYRLQRYREGVYRLPQAPQPQDSLPLTPGQSLEVPGFGRLGLQPSASCGIALGDREALELHWRRGGESCRPAHGPGAGSLKDWMRQAQVPPWWRERLPLLALGGEILAVGGLGACRSSRWREVPAAGESLWQLQWEPAAECSVD
ncbi:tRNA lysidine(34) synthetase TilS [Mangrovimicrobium sediminis]|uniref:tRNA lysidine(34) synthetase TilS n=1 Tax=Mangrovimicrobium sediminis TaxID=2562682 RepID=UPI0014369EA6|nr:tRNA lysidine(34) synthetase TilS [Haliea sp. SAOS-164]